MDKNSSGSNADYYVSCFEWHNRAPFEAPTPSIRVWGNDELTLKQPLQLGLGLAEPCGSVVSWPLSSLEIVSFVCEMGHSRKVITEIKKKKKSKSKSESSTVESMLHHFLCQKYCVVVKCICIYIKKMVEEH